jgi:hypothetical protein
MGAIEGQKILDSQDWESVKRRGRAAIEKWIDEQMRGKSAVVVLVGNPAPPTADNVCSALATAPTSTSLHRASEIMLEHVTVPECCRGAGVGDFASA